MELEISLRHESSCFLRVIAEAIALLGCYATRFVFRYQQFRNQIFKDQSNPDTVHLQFQLKEKSIACIFNRSEMLRHVDVCLVSDVSKKHSAFIS